MTFRHATATRATAPVSSIRRRTSSPPPTLAAKATRDAFEQDADRVADQIVDGAANSSGHDFGRTAIHPATSRAETPPIVADLLRSPGRPLDAATRAFMEPRFGHDFGHVRIHTDAPAAGAAAALGAEAFAFGHHIAFARERFRPGTTQGMRLMAHELTHTVQQAGRSPSLALKPDPQSALVGKLLGKDRMDRQILVKREVGDVSGYDDRRQASAVARLAKAEPAAVAQDKNGKWHAFETETGIDIQTASAYDPEARKAEALAHAGVQFKDVHILPPLSALKPAGQQTDETRAALIFGAETSEIQINATTSQRQAGKINLTATPEKGSGSDARHGPVVGQKDTDFHLGLVTAFDLDKALLDKPAHAAGTLFHEVSHLMDFELAQRWVATYEKETGRTYMRAGLKLFMDWINAQAKKKPPRLSTAEAQLVVDEAADVTASTEARANIRTFLEYFRAAIYDEATQALTNYAGALPPVGRAYGSPPAGSPVLVELAKEMKAAYDRADKTARAQFDAAMASAKAKNKSAWFV
ncbi:DUF4157 domain-containing protein [Bradyrhizobium liaoningense]|uniref:eCIS core domain-containing protein n=1 Tax=Bradyrhizobium liaoningense TaxID=43992 RepID=UPI001BAB6E31|nr:DUF4157 domain-containing protein [Bradyrhizobium liaoningense]MBR0714547.1 DUF4157 domain-containing protein [Bradyrhizobium liaoningense]